MAPRVRKHIYGSGFQSETFFGETRSHSRIDRALAPEQKIAATSDAIVLFLRCLSGAFSKCFFSWTGLNITRFASHRHYPSTNQTVPVKDCKISCTIPPKHNFSLSQTTCQGPRAKRLAKSSPTYSPGALRNNQALCNLMQFQQPQWILDTTNLQHGSKQPCLMLVGVEPLIDVDHPSAMGETSFSSSWADQCHHAWVCRLVLSGVSFRDSASRRNAGIYSIRKTRTIVCTTYFINLFVDI